MDLVLSALMWLGMSGFAAGRFDEWIGVDKLVLMFVSILVLVLVSCCCVVIDSLWFFCYCFIHTPPPRDSFVKKHSIRY